jgi:hypothetical protein
MAADLKRFCQSAQYKNKIILRFLLEFMIGWLITIWLSDYN